MTDKPNNSYFLRECQKSLRNAIACYFAFCNSMDMVKIEKITEEIADGDGNVWVACIYRRDE